MPRTGLGRGLGDLISRTDPDLETENRHPAPPGSHFAELRIEQIRPNPRQPRQVFDTDALAELADSITEVGLLQPVVVRPLGNDEYELVMGERRDTLAAARAESYSGRQYWDEMADRHRNAVRDRPSG